MLQKKAYLYFLLFFAALTNLSAQEESPFVTYDVPSQNLLKFNRFLINPTFSTVREDKSYVNLLHRNQSVSFADNNQTYFLSYSGRMNDRTGLGLSLYNQSEGIISNYGVLANYAYGIKLSDKSNFTFGANLSYYNSGINRNKANPIEDDPLLNSFQDNSLLSFQPGFNLSYNNFDVGVFAENLFDYNLKTNTSVTEFKDKTYSAHLQYTHEFKNNTGILERARVMPLARVRKVGQDDIVLGGSLILDLPKLGWLQGGYDSFYGASAGVGFNLNKRLSIGYTMEKGLSGNFDNFGVTHEVSFAFSITPTLTEDRVMLEEKEDELLALTDEPTVTETLTEKEIELAELRAALAENNLIIEELMLRQDSLEENHKTDIERRFDLMMRMMQNQNHNAIVQQPSPKKSYAINNVVSPNKRKTPATKSVASVRQLPEKTKDNFTTAAQKHQIKHKTFVDLENVTDGFYMVANVYKGPKYMNAFIDGLQSQGIDAAYFTNPKNDLKYVYLKRFDTWEEAVAAHQTKMNGAYNDDVWIMNVAKQSTTDAAYAANVTKIKEKSSQYNQGSLQQNIIKRDGISEAMPSQKSYKINGVANGYYIIANVFAKAANANQFVKLLNSQGLSASYFINPTNNYRYVYLKKHTSWNTALVSYYSKLNDAYDQKMWIMRVTPNELS